MCIGMIQVLVMIEISIHIDSNFRVYDTHMKMQTQRNPNTKKVLMADILASKNFAQKWILGLRCVIVLSVAASIIGLWIFFYSGDDKKAIKIYHVNEYTPKISWGFLAVTILLTASIFLLFYCIRTRSPKIDNLSNTFRKEFRNLKITLLLFDFTYIIRWISDEWVIPYFFELPDDFS